MATRFRLSETPRGTSSQSTSTNRKLFEEDDRQDSSEANNSSPWITRNEDGKLRVLALDLPQHPDICKLEFTNFVTIMGPARQGKSFLMNCLIGEDAFGTADTMETCTNGVEVANVVHRVGNGCALFVDTEGQGDKNVDSDATLLTPVLLLSKVVLFNWKGGLQKNQILNELAVLVEVGNCVSSHSFDEGKAKFGHLHIVLRDYHFQGTAEDVFKMIFKIKRGENLRELNKIREKLLSSFESVDVSILPAPCDTSNKEIRDLDFLKTSKEFQESVHELKKKILDQMKEARCFGNTVVHSKNANFFVEKFVKELEKGDVVHLKSAVAQFQRGIVNAAKRSFEEAIVQAYKDIDVPVKDGIEEKLTQQKDALLKAFEDLTGKVDVEATYRDEVLEKLEEFSDREMEAKRRENLLAIRSREAEQQTLLSKAVQEFRAAVESELERSKETSSGNMKREFETHKQKGEERFLESTNDLDWIAELVEDELKKLRSWASSRLNEKVKAKEKEEAYKQRSEQQAGLARAGQDFRSGVENYLQKNHQTDSQRFRNEFQAESESLVQAFRRNTDGLDQISEQAREELERLRSWASKRMEEKSRALIESEQLEQRLKAANEKEQLSRQRVEQQQRLMQQQSTEMGQLSRQRDQQQMQQQEYEPFNSPSYPSHSSYSDPSTPYSFSPSPAQSTRQSDSPSKFYKGGQFIPGGGRAPAGGCYMTPSAGSSSGSSSGFSSSGGDKFYKGGQFTPGGGRAPAGGCYMPPSAGSSSGSSSAVSSSGGNTFYKGGQFTPGGGRAPKGGCWK